MINPLEEEFNNDPSKLSALASIFSEKNKEAGTATLTFNELYISSINQAKLLFLNKLGQKFYPAFTSTYFASYIHKQQDQDGASFFRYDDAFNSAYFKLKPYQCMFYGKSRRSQDVWSLSLNFWLPDRFVNVMSAIELEEVIRLNATTGTSDTPLVQLREYRTVNNEVKIETLINENLPTPNTALKRFSF